jgi:hypothetical protein
MRRQDMSDTMETRVADIGMRLIHDAYLAWMAAEAESGRALREWCARWRHDGSYFAYLAALDREEAAALDLRDLVDVAGDCEDSTASDG